jgi:hypothetical protein
MKKILIALAVLVLALVAFNEPPVHANQIIAYQDFTGSTVPSGINLFNGTEAGCPVNECVGITRGVNGGPPQNQISNGWIDMWIFPGQSVANPISFPQVGFEMNGTDPVITVQRGENSLTVLTFRILALNATLSQSTGFFASLSFGLMDSYQAGNPPYAHRIFWSADIISAIGFSGYYGLAPGVELPEGTPSGTPRPICPESVNTFMGLINGACNGIQPGGRGPVYGTRANAFDMSKIHTYQIAYMKHQATNSSWAAFSVDSMGWMNVTQQACDCFGGPTATTPNLFPFVNLTVAGMPASARSSIGTFVNYLLVTDYVPVGDQIPAGTLLPFFGPPPLPTCSGGGYTDVGSAVRCAVTDVGGGSGNCFTAGTNTICFGPVIGGLLVMFGLVFTFGLILVKLGLREPLIFGGMAISIMTILFIINVLPTWFIYMIVGTVITEFAGVFPKVGFRKKDEGGFG